MVLAHTVIRQPNGDFAIRQYDVTAGTNGEFNEIIIPKGAAPWVGAQLAYEALTPRANDP